MGGELTMKVETSELDVERLRAPGWRILVRPVRIETVTAGGIALPQQAVEEREYLQFVAQVVAMGPQCYRHPKFLDGDPWCKPGDWVLLRQYAGQGFLVRDENGEEVRVRLVNDDEVLAVADTPEALVL